MRDPADFSRNVFINCPFDREYQSLFEAMVFAVWFAGFSPRCPLEASNAGQARLAKIMDIISECQYGIHDISRTELGRDKLPRFNMPLELGLDLGCRRYGSDHLTKKRLLVMDRSRYRYQRVISDIAGQDIVSHSNHPRHLIRCIRDWLSTESRSSAMPGGLYMYQSYLAFQDVLPSLCRRVKLNPRQLTFGDFSFVVRVWMEEDEI
jgi:hypothetical protein